jgi:hypothetical protein
MLEHGAMSVDEIAQRAGVHEDLSVHPETAWVH